VLLPVALMSAYLYVSRRFYLAGGALADYIAIGVAIAGGAWVLWAAALDRQRRINIMLVYVPAVAVALFFWSFWFIAAVFREGL